MSPLDRRTQDAVAASRAAGTALADYFAAGGQPEAVAAPYRLNPGEFCVGGMQGVVDQWLEGDGSYTHRTVVLGGVVGIGVDLHPSGIPPLRLEIPSPDWFTVMLHKIAWGQVVHPPRPDGPAALER